ncbi:MAG: DUF4835 family protein [Prolixibacteraceae bacterium]|nr:DUF4835 family protein [Prolixibacteraceae bacterium]MBN2773075.1 DUF4835 family protein [Prolixibacteraceae bacterium]
MKRLFILLFLIGIFFYGNSQDLRCRVSVQSTKIRGANRNLFRTMQVDITDFMNNRQWTDHKYQMDERIECNIFIKLDQQISSDEFKGTINVQLKRPVFGSTYESSVLNIQDEDFQCKYVEFQPLEFNETNNKDNLTNVLAYYAYIIIGMDYDTFSPEGGTPYYEKAQQIVQNSQNAREKGWKSFESERNRYWLVENLLNRSYSDFRTCMYNYHRLGLDVMSDKPEEGRAVIAESLRGLQKVFRRRPSVYILQVFFDAKKNELVQVFTESYPDERNRVLTILNEVDPSNGTLYESIKESSDI